MPNKCGSIGGNRGTGGGGTSIGPKLEPIEERQIVLAERAVVADERRVDAFERQTIAVERIAHCFNHLCVGLIALVEHCQRMLDQVEKDAKEARAKRQQEANPLRKMRDDQ